MVYSFSGLTILLLVKIKLFGGGYIRLSKELLSTIETFYFVSCGLDWTHLPGGKNIDSFREKD